MQENNKFKSILQIVSSIGYLERLWMNQAYEEPLVFTSNNQSKLYFSQVSKYPCNSKMIFNTLLVLKNVTYQSTRKDVTVTPQ